jgi:MFS family permease
VPRSNLRLLCRGWAASRVAEWAFQVVVGVYAFQAGGAVAVAAVMFARMVPGAAVSLIGTSFADRFPRERVLLAVEVLRTAIALATAVAVGSHASTVVIVFAAACYGAASSISLPTAFSLLPSIVADPPQLVSANAYLLTAQGVGALAGPVVGGVTTAALGAAAGMLSASAASAVAAVLIALIRIDGGRLEPETAPTVPRFRLGGVRAVGETPGTRLILALFGAQTLVRGLLTVMIVVVALDLLGLSQAWVGFLTAAPGAGALLAAMRSRRLAGRSLAWPFLAGLSAWGLPLVALGAVPGPVMALVALFVVGAGDATLDVSGYSLLERAVPDHVLARVFGVHNAITLATVGIGSLAAPVLIDSIGIRASLAAAGGMLPVLALAAARPIGAIDRTVLPPSAVIDLIRRVPMFAPLSLAAVEQIAARLVRVDVTAGQVVIREGDIGDRFYVVDEGAFDLERDGVHAVISGRGEYFGEIALLRDLPRTATITATTVGRVFALGRHDFLAAVSGHHAGWAAGQAIVEERMPLEVTRR